MIINSIETHELALKKLSELEENYENNKIAFGVLFDLIYEYEKTVPELADFNNRMKKLDDIEKLNSTYW